MLISMKISRNSAFFRLRSPRMLFFPLKNVKMPTIIVGILTFMSWKNFMLSRAECENSFITSGPYLEDEAPPKEDLLLKEEFVSKGSHIL